MRLSLGKGAPSTLSETVWQEIPAPPDFLWNSVALANFMRLSLGKGAPAALCKTVWQEIPGREMSKRCAVCALIRLLQKFLGKFLGKFFGEFFGFDRFFFEWLLVFAIDGGPEDGAGTGAAPGRVTRSD